MQGLAHSIEGSPKQCEVKSGQGCFGFLWFILQDSRYFPWLGCLTFPTWGFPSQFIQIDQGVKGHSTRAAPGVPRTWAGLEPGTSRFSNRRINHYATRGGDISNASLSIKDHRGQQLTCLLSSVCNLYIYNASLLLAIKGFQLHTWSRNFMKEYISEILLLWNSWLIQYEEFDMLLSHEAGSACSHSRSTGIKTSFAQIGIF